VDLEISEQRSLIRKQIRDQLKVHFQTGDKKEIRDFSINRRSLSLIEKWRAQGLWCGFQARDNEPNLSELFDSSEGVKWAFPVVDSRAAQMNFYEPKDRRALSVGYNNIPEPDIHVSRLVPKEEINGFLVPCLAVDRFGHRLGTGKGFYDKYLEGNQKLKIGICYDCQVVSEEIPACDWDVAMDWIVTESQSIECRKD